jgi:amidophosphoribosyltransferase
MANDTRTFIRGSADRVEKAEKKYDIDPQLMRGRTIILVDDSVVRGTTMKVLVKRLREEGGVAEIHLRVEMPAIVSPCCYGIDFSMPDELITRKFSDGTLTGSDELSAEILQQIADELGIDSLKYTPSILMPDALKKNPDHLCTACFTKNYPTPNGAKFAASAELKHKAQLLQIR